MGCIEFLNILSYLHDKAEHDKAELRKWRAKN